MSDDRFTGSTRDPIVLLEQLIGHVAAVRRDVSEFKQEVRQELGQIKQELGQVKQELGETRQDLSTRIDGVRGELLRYVGSVDQDQAAFRTQVENTVERKTWVSAERLRQEWNPRFDELERRLVQLEEAERRRRAGEGA